MFGHADCRKDYPTGRTAGTPHPIRCVRTGLRELAQMSISENTDDRERRRNTTNRNEMIARPPESNNRRDQKNDCLRARN